jgi:hypothetical protein
MSDLAPDEYEKELRRQLEDTLGRWVGGQSEISFEREYPDTVLTIAWQRPDGAPVSISLTIWKGKDEYLTYDDPERAATDIAVMVLER